MTVRAFVLRKPVDREQALASLRWLQDEKKLRPGTSAMIEGIWRISDTRVKDIMVPRPKVVTIADDAGLNDIVKAAVGSGHSRFPVIGDDLDKIHGVLLAKDLLQYLGDGENNFDINNHIRRAVVVPQSKRLNVLLDEFRKSRNHMAVVVDEYGGMCGVVTIEDVLEQIVGEISDEHDLAADHYVRDDGRGHYVVKAFTPLEYFNRFFSAALESKSVDTIGGLVIEVLGRMPRRNEKVLVQGISFEVFQSDRRRIHSLLIERKVKS